MFWGEILTCVLNSLASSIRSYNNVFVVNFGKKCFSFPGQKKLHLECKTINLTDFFLINF